MAEGCQTNPEYFARSPFNMADAWREDLKLREDIERYVRPGYKRGEALDFLKRDFPMYAWSIRSLDRRLRCFEIYYNNPEVSVDEVKDAVKKELEGPGRPLGYRAMHKKVRQEYNLHVTRHAVYNVMSDLDPEGLEARDGIGAKNKASTKSKVPTCVAKCLSQQCLMFSIVSSSSVNGTNSLGPILAYFWAFPDTSEDNR